MATPTSVDAYLAALPEDARKVLQELRKTIKAAAPEATETIAYQMPAFKSHGRFLVSYAAYKDHYSLFPASGAVMKALGDELTPYVTGKATIQFRADNALSPATVTKLVKIRLAETAASSPSG
jgi:uncharacterized protein YdhG (YjbR/CyaY superfamily)